MSIHTDTQEERHLRRNEVKADPGQFRESFWTARRQL